MGYEVTAAFPLNIILQVLCIQIIFFRWFRDDNHLKPPAWLSNKFFVFCKVHH